MLQRIISVRNVGRFRNCAAAGDVTLRRATLVYAENGRGKTTLCAILRSLYTSNPDLILGRTSLGAGGAPDVHLLFGGGQQVIFRNNQWSVPYPDIAIFDATYVNENVFAGDVVATEHRRNLYRVIIGAEGVELANRVNALEVEIRAKTTELREVRAGLLGYLVGGLNLDAFLALPQDEHIDASIEAVLQEQLAAQQVAELLRRLSPQPLAIPAFPPPFAALLGKTLPDVAVAAERMVTAHIAKHALGDGGERWLSEGLRHAQDDCPFCGQALAGVDLIGAYQAFFSEAYLNLRGEVEELRRAVADALSDRAAGAIENTLNQSNYDVAFWKGYCQFQLAPSLEQGGGISEVFAALREASLALLQQKAATPLETVAPDERYTHALEAFEALRTAVSTYNAAVAAADAVIQEKKRATQTADLTAITARLARLRSQQARHTPLVMAQCQREAAIQRGKGQLEEEKDRAKGQLDAHTDQVIERYGNSINRYLERINAGFRITVPVHNYRGGPNTSYQILINQTPVDLGDADTPAGRPSFRNTLSSGDKSTLALAFFLAQLEQDQGRAQKIVVFDDPFTSLDAFRRNHTVHQVYKCVADNAQVIVLSHDAHFLKALWDRADPASRKTLQLARIGEENTTMVEWDIEQAVRARYMADIDTLTRFYSLSEGEVRQVIQTIRPVLEGFCRNLYPTQFGEDTMGEIIGKINGADPPHPLAPIYDDLDELNRYCRRYHHGDNPGAALEPVDNAELVGYVSRTLKVVGCLL